MSLRRIGTIGLLACLALTPALVEATINPVSLLDSVVHSHVIVLGHITEVREATYLFEVREAIKGPYDPGEVMEIARFQDSSCTSRREPYLVGQEMLVFVVDGRQRSTPRDWTLYGGLESEARVLDGNVYLGFPRGVHGWVETTAGLVTGEGWPVETVVEALRAVDSVVRVRRFDGAFVDLQLVPGDEEKARSFLASRNRLLAALAADLLQRAQ